MPMRVPMKIGRAMTVVRGDDGLVIFNSMRLSEEGLRELDALGDVRHVVRLAGFHGRDDGFYRDRYGATVYAIEGQRYFRGMDPKKQSVASFMEPDVWLDEESTLPIPGARLKVIASCDPTEALCLIEREGGRILEDDSLEEDSLEDVSLEEDSLEDVSLEDDSLQDVDARGEAVEDVTPGSERSNE